MMGDMTLSELARTTRAWQDRNFDGLTVPIQLLVLAEETGEACRAVAKELHGIRPGSRGNLAEELCDVIMCAASIADRAGFDLDAEMNARLERLLSLDFRTDPEASQK
jgi:NTP pyrophosphatase (non-canonical NTP hydrolase)